MATNNNNKALNVPHLRFPEFSGVWKKVRLGEKCNMLCGYAFNGEDIVEQGSYLLMRGINITEGSIRHSSELDRYYSGSIEKLDKYKLAVGDLVIGMDGSKVGRNSAIVSSYEDGSYLVQRVCRIKSSIGNNYILQFINNTKFHQYVDTVKTSSAIPHISLGDIQNFRISIPPTQDETDKIAKLFLLLDERIATQNKIIEDLKKLKSAISKHLFARKDLLETTICLSNIATLKNGYAFQSSKYNVLGKWKILTITNVSGERYINDEDCNCIINLPNDIQDHQVLKEGDILISLTGNVGRVSLCKNGDYLLNQRVGLLQLAKNVNQEFLYQILSSQKFENSMIACGQGAAQMNIGKGDVESYVLPYSSNGNNILWVAKILHSYDECIINEMRRLTLLTMQKQYLLTQMFI
ncbi:restriction endonuclease subunit S [Alistipes putredinis]